MATESKALTRVKKHKGTINGTYGIRLEGIAITLRDLETIIANVRLETINGSQPSHIAFMIGKITKADGGRFNSLEYTVEVLPCHIANNTSHLLEKDGIIGASVSPWEDQDNSGGGGGVNQKTPPPFPPQRPL